MNSFSQPTLSILASLIPSNSILWSFGLYFRASGSKVGKSCSKESPLPSRGCKLCSKVKVRTELVSTPSSQVRAYHVREEEFTD